MAERMSSRERMLAAITHQEPDRVPLHLHFFQSQNIVPPSLRWRDQFERVEKFLTVLGIDDVVSISTPRPLSGKVGTTCREESTPEERYPLLIKEYKTEKGILRQVVRRTEDWPHGDDVPLAGDFNVPRSKEFLMKGPEDLDRLKCLLVRPSADELDRLRTHAAEMKKFADKWAIMVQGHVESPGTTACHLAGMENVVYEAVTRPEYLLEFLRILHEWQMWGLEPLLDLHVCDMVVVNGFYESLQLWSPRLYREFFFDFFREKIEMIHQAGAKCAYNMTSKLMPLLPFFRELGFDVLRWLDPVMGEPDLAGLKREIGDQLCFLGGVNGTLTIGRGTREEVKQAVTDAIRILAPGGGLILSAADAVFSDAPWENVMTMIDTWKEIGEYPIELA